MSCETPDLFGLGASAKGQAKKSESEDSDKKVENSNGLVIDFD